MPGAEAQREDPLPELPVRAVDDEAWSHFLADPSFMAHRWADADAAVVRFRLGLGALTVLSSFPARAVWGEETFPGIPGGPDRLGAELDANGAHALLPGTIIDALLMDATRPEPSPYVMAFDLPRYRGHSLATSPYAERFALLGQACEELREAGAWPSDWIQAWGEAPWRLGGAFVLRDLRARMGEVNAAVAPPRRRR